MNFTDVFIRRPVFATVLSLIILLIGIRSYYALTVRLFPNVSASTITVTTAYTGASASLMEGFVTTPIENAISGVDGIDYITSSSAYGVSTITIYFNLGYDLNTAITDISNKVSSVRWLLPKDVYDPVIDKQDPNASATMYISFSSDRMSGEDVTDYLYRVVQPQMQVLLGVGQADVWSAHKYGMRIWLDPYAMAARNITASDVISGLNMGNLQSPSGVVKTNLQSYNVNTISDLATAQQFNSLVLINNNGQLTRIRDIGRVELGSAITDVSVVIDGKDGVVVAITPQSNANPLDVSTVINNYLEKLKANMPAGMSYFLIQDSSKYIAESINEVKKTVVEAVIFVIAVVFLFIGSWRVLLVPVVAIPLSIIGVCGIMLAMGYSLNTLTFLALVLAIGMVVDDAIVVSENIHRHIAEGKKPLEAALIGAREIQFAIISMTLTLAAVYAPIGFMSGLTGALFKEFAFTLASAVIISGFIALTLSPMMCSKVMSANVLEGKFAKFIDNSSCQLMVLYRKFLECVLGARKIVLIVVGIVLLACYTLFHFIPSELAPAEDVGFIFVVAAGPSSANIHYTEKYTNKLPAIYSSIPETLHYGIINGAGDVNKAMSFVALKPWSERTRTVDQIIGSTIMQFLAIPGINAFPMNPFNLPGAASNQPISVALQTMGSFEDLNQLVQKIMLAIKVNPAIVNVDSDLKLDKPQLDINIDRSKAGDLGISAMDIANAINFAFSEGTQTHFTISGRSYDVIPALDQQYRNRPDIINNLQLRTVSGDLVPLSNLVTVKDSIGPNSYNHFQQLRTATITANLMPGYTMGQALGFIEKQVRQIAPNVKIDYSGQSRQFMQSSGAMGITFGFAIIFIFLVLAAQFESFRDPFVVMFCIPLSTFGAMLALWFIHGTLNIYSEIGLVTLIGLICKHGILMVEFANQLQEEGKSIHEAIVEAASIRLRPILMTTGAMVLGALPLAFASGAGAISRQQIGWVVVGGMLIGTIFTLFVVPTMYTYLAEKKSCRESVL